MHDSMYSIDQLYCVLLLHSRLVELPSIKLCLTGKQIWPLS